MAKGRRRRLAQEKAAAVLGPQENGEQKQIANGNEALVDVNSQQQSKSILQDENIENGIETSASSIQIDAGNGKICDESLQNFAMKVVTENMKRNTLQNTPLERIPAETENYELAEPTEAPQNDQNAENAEDRPADLHSQHHAENNQDPPDATTTQSPTANGEAQDSDIKEPALLTLISRDKQNFQVSYEAADVSATLYLVRRQLGFGPDRNNGVIELSTINGSVLRHVVAWMEHNKHTHGFVPYSNDTGLPEHPDQRRKRQIESAANIFGTKTYLSHFDGSEWDAEFLGEFDQRTLTEIRRAAEYMIIRPLSTLCWNRL